MAWMADAMELMILSIIAPALRLVLSGFKNYYFFEISITSSQDIILYCVKISKDSNYKMSLKF